MNDNPVRGPRGGFTLIEMMVAMVIAMIIVMLSSYAWRSANTVVSRTDALLEAHATAAHLMSTFRSTAEQSTATLPMVVENQLLNSSGTCNLAFYFGDGNTLAGPGGDTYLRDDTLPKINEGTVDDPRMVYPIALWGTGKYDSSHSAYYADADGKKVKKSSSFYYNIGTEGFRFRWTGYTRLTDIAGTKALTTNPAASWHNKGSYLVPGGYWQADNPYFYRRSLTPDGSFPAENMKFAYRSLSGDPSHHSALLVPGTVEADDKYVYAQSGAYKKYWKNISGATQPDWPTEYGETVQDGDITWQAIAPTLWYEFGSAPFMSYIETYTDDKNVTNYPLRGSFNQHESRGQPTRYGTLPSGSRTPFAHGIGKFELEWDTAINDDPVSFDDGTRYRNLDQQQPSNDTTEIGYVGFPICRGFAGNDPRGGEPCYQPRSLKLNFNVVKIPSGTEGEAVVQDFSVRAWIR